MKRTSQLIAEFNRAFGIAVHDRVQQPTVSERILLGKLLLEETLETITEGLGLKLVFHDPGYGTIEVASKNFDSRDGELELYLDEGVRYDPIETADGLGDVNVVIHHVSHRLGFDLDKVTEEIHESNMSKLDDEGKPIINECKHYGGDKVYRPFESFGPEAIPEDLSMCHNRIRTNSCDDPSHLIDPTKPAGKILKGPNFRLPDIEGTIMGCWQKDCPDYGIPGHSHNNCED